MKTAENDCVVRRLRPMLRWVGLAIVAVVIPNVIHFAPGAEPLATVSFKERTDVTAVPALGVVGETMMALVLAAEALRKFGGDSVPEFVRNWRSFVDAL